MELTTGGQPKKKQSGNPEKTDVWADRGPAGEIELEGLVEKDGVNQPLLERGRGLWKKPSSCSGFVMIGDDDKIIIMMMMT